MVIVLILLEKSPTFPIRRQLKYQPHLLLILRPMYFVVAFVVYKIRTPYLLGIRHFPTVFRPLKLHGSPQPNLAIKLIYSGLILYPLILVAPPLVVIPQYRNEFLFVVVVRFNVLFRPFGLTQLAARQK